MKGLSADGARMRAIEEAAKHYYEHMTGGTRTWDELVPETEPDKERSRQLAALLLDAAHRSGTISWERWE